MFPPETTTATNAAQNTMRARILAHAAQHTETLSCLEQTRNATSSLRTQKAINKALDNQIVEATKPIPRLERAVQAAHARCSRSTNPLLRRIFSGLGGECGRRRFEKRVMNARFKLQRALEIEREAKKELRETKLMREMGTDRRRKLENDIILHENAQMDLDDLYENVFAGPSDEWQEEDWAKRDVNVAIRAFEMVDEEAQAAREVVRCLSSAHCDAALMRGEMEYVLHNLEPAMHSYLASLYPTQPQPQPQSPADTRAQLRSARTALRNARELAGCADELIGQAAQVDAAIGLLAPLEVPLEVYTSDIISADLETYSTDAQHITEQIGQSEDALVQLLDDARKREDVLNSKLNHECVKIEHAKSELQKVRQGIFREVVQDEVARIESLR